MGNHGLHPSHLVDGLLGCLPAKRPRLILKTGSVTIGLLLLLLFSMCGMNAIMMRGNGAKWTPALIRNGVTPSLVRPLISSMY